MAKMANTPKVKAFKDLLRNQIADDLETWYAELIAVAQSGLFK